MVIYLSVLDMVARAEFPRQHTDPPPDTRRKPRWTTTTCQTPRPCPR